MPRIQGEVRTGSGHDCVSVLTHPLSGPGYLLPVLRLNVLMDEKYRWLRKQRFPNCSWLTSTLLLGRDSKCPGFQPRKCKQSCPFDERDASRKGCGRSTAGSSQLPNNGICNIHSPESTMYKSREKNARTLAMQITQNR